MSNSYRMKIESTKGAIEVETIAAAAAWLVEMQPSYASIDGIDIDTPGDEWTLESAAVAIAEAIAEDATTWEARESLREQLAGLPAGGGE